MISLCAVVFPSSLFFHLSLSHFLSPFLSHFLYLSSSPLCLSFFLTFSFTLSQKQKDDIIFGMALSSSSWCLSSIENCKCMLLHGIHSCASPISQESIFLFIFLVQMNHCWSTSRSQSRHLINALQSVPSSNQFSSLHFSLVSRAQDFWTFDYICFGQTEPLSLPYKKLFTLTKMLYCI